MPSLRKILRCGVLVVTCLAAFEAHAVVCVVATDCVCHGGIVEHALIAKVVRTEGRGLDARATVLVEEVRSRGEPVATAGSEMVLERMDANPGVRVIAFGAPQVGDWSEVDAAGTFFCNSATGEPSRLPALAAIEVSVAANCDSLARERFGLEDRPCPIGCTAARATDTTPMLVVLIAFVIVALRCRLTRVSERGRSSPDRLVQLLRRRHPR